jgi:hypothetical protein
MIIRLGPKSTPASSDTLVFDRKFTRSRIPIFGFLSLSDGKDSGLKQPDLPL